MLFPESYGELHMKNNGLKTLNYQNVYSYQSTKHLPLSLSINDTGLLFTHTITGP